MWNPPMAIVKVNVKKFADMAGRQAHPAELRNNSSPACLWSYEFYSSRPRIRGAPNEQPHWRAAKTNGSLSYYIVFFNQIFSLSTRVCMDIEWSFFSCCTPLHTIAHLHDSDGKTTPFNIESSHGLICLGMRLCPKCQKLSWKIGKIIAMKQKGI